jgi:uncharacterized protein (TIRG00374 family)
MAGKVALVKKLVITILQALVTVVLLYWIFRNPEKREMMWVTVQDANWRWFLPGLAAVGAMTVLQTLRWLWLMKVQSIQPSFRRAYGMNLVGMFFNLFLPGGTGGDLLKMYYASREAEGRKPAAVLSVFMDRVVGLLALIGIAAVVGLFSFEQVWAARELRGFVLTLGCIVGGALGFLLVVFAVEFFHLSKRLPSWLPLRHLVLEMASAFSTYARAGSALWASVLISLPAHAIIFFSFYCCARAFTDELTLGQLFLVLPLILTISALPISVAGLGVREQLFHVTLGALFGVPAAVGVLIGFSGFLLNVVWGAVGGVVYIFYRPSKQPDGKSITDMEAEMEAVEREIEDTAP